MKLITLNTWGGRAGKEEQLEFFRRNKENIDVFCLQEMWKGPNKHLEKDSTKSAQDMNHDNILVYGVDEISSICSKHTSRFHPQYLNYYGLMLLVKDIYPILEEGDVFVHKYHGFEPIGDVGHHARNIQYVKTQINESEVTVINFHGLWNGKGKLDSKDRITQSNNITNFIKKLDGKIVFCGDFNLHPETESIAILEKIGLRNLIKDYDIKSTRTSHYTKDEKFADYVFVSDNVKVNEFKVLPDEISDHAALYLDFE
jgi:endonuclease/exonuclease/phosphatase family metal-dependent hydrolase